MAAEQAVTVAALDCGTNSTRLLVVGPDGGVLERAMRITRLGEGVDATGVLNPAAIVRTLEVLAGYRARMDEHAVARARLVATSAVRDASNAEEFLAAARTVTGVEPEQLSGDEEGRLSFLGATARLPPGVRGGDRVLVVDIGGGSTELAAGPAPVLAPNASSAAPSAGESRAPGTPDIAVASLDVGCVRLTERYLRHDPPLDSELSSARAHVMEALAGAAPSLAVEEGFGLLVGLAGTVSTLAALAQGLTCYERARIHHFVLSRDDVESWFGRLAGETSAARGEHAGMDVARADVIVGGIVILIAAMDLVGARRCLVSEDDILDGLVSTLR